jgi:hypothetical protein
MTREFNKYYIDGIIGIKKIENFNKNSTLVNMLK